MIPLKNYTKRSYKTMNLGSVVV